MRLPMRAWISRRYARLVCWMIARQLGGREIVVQKDGIDFDSGKFSGVFPVETAQGIRFVVTIFCVHGVPQTFGVQAKTRLVEYPEIAWDRTRRQIIVRHYDET